MTTVIGLRYEVAIPLEKNNRAAGALVGGTCLISLAIGLILCLAVWLGGEAFATGVGAPDLATLLWLLPPCAVLWGIGSALSFWTIRQGMFRLNGLNRIVHYGVQAGGQLGLGTMSIGGAGLVFGYALGYLARTVHLVIALPNAELRLLLRPSVAEMGAGLRRHWRYPVFSGSASTMRTASAMLPSVLIAALYGPALAGLYALAQRVVGLPLRLLGESASQVFLGELRNMDHAGFIQLFKRTTVLFTVMGLMGMLPLALLGPWLFALVFGENWREAGLIMQLLVPLYLTRFIVTPISHTLNATERQDVLLWSSGLNIITLVGSFGAGWWFELTYFWTIVLFSVSSSLTFVFTIAAAWRILRTIDWQTLQATRLGSKENSAAGSGPTAF